MKLPKKVSTDEIYETNAYELLDAFCDDDKGGQSDFIMADRFDRNQVVNLLYPLIKKEIRKR